MMRNRASRWIFGLLAAALLLRLWIAYGLLPDSGYPGDLHWYSMWATSVTTFGPGEFYARTDANYPPGYIYILWCLGEISHVIRAAIHSDARDITSLLIKVPPILFDIGSGFLLYRITLHWCDQNVAQVRIALLVAASYLFNPVSLYDSAIWGQTDAVGVFIMLLGVTSLLRWPPEVSACIAVVATLVKPQFGMVVVPLVGVVLVRRHAKLIEVSDGKGSWVRWGVRDAYLRILTSFVSAVVLFYLLLAPFNMGLEGFLKLMALNVQKYQDLTLNAFNPWALVGSGPNPPLVLAGVEHGMRDDIHLFGPVTGVELGTALLSLGFILGVARLFWRIDWLSIILVGAFLSLCFFILPTRVHERYLFPTFAFTSLLIYFDRRWLWINAALAIGALINLHAVLSVIGTENVKRLPFGDLSGSPAGITLSVVLQTAGFLFIGWRLWFGKEIGNWRFRAAPSGGNACA